jgi:hypothetical protein
MSKGKNWLFAALALTGGFIGGIVATEFAPGVADAARHMKTVRAEQFELVDRGGTRRGVLNVTSRGMADLALFDGQERDRAEFRVAQDGGSSIGFYDAQGNRRVLVGETPSGRDGIAIYGTNDRQLASLTVAEDNQASLTLYDPGTGKARAGLGVASDGSPALALFDKNGHDRAELHLTKSGKPGLALADENGKTIAGLPETATTQPQ